MATFSTPLPLEAKDLSVGYRQGQSEHVLFEKINLFLAPGKLTCFMGPNGIGKSTLIRVLAGLQQPLQGEIAIPGEKKIALVLTDKITATNLTVWDLVSFGRYPYLPWGITFSKEDIKIIGQSIDDVGIPMLANKKN